MVFFQWRQTQFIKIFSSNWQRHGMARKETSKLFRSSPPLMLQRQKTLIHCFKNPLLSCITHPPVSIFSYSLLLVKCEVSNAKIKKNFSPSLCSTSPLPLPIFFSPLLMRGWLPTVSWVCGPSAHDPLAAASWNPPTTTYNHE